MMAYRVAAFLFVLTLLVVDDSLGMPRGKVRSKRQTSALATLLSFSVKLSDMERLINTHEKRIDRQDTVLDQLLATIDSKADRTQFQGLEVLLNSKMSTLKSDIATKELVIERYRNKLRQLEEEITEVQLEYAKLNDRTNEVKSKFDDFGLDCSRKVTTWAPRGDGPILYLDRQSVRCAQDQFLQSFVLRLASDYSGDHVRYVYRCCRLSI